MFLCLWCYNSHLSLSAYPYLHPLLSPRFSNCHCHNHSTLQIFLITIGLNLSNFHTPCFILFLSFLFPKLLCSTHFLKMVKLLTFSALLSFCRTFGVFSHMSFKPTAITNCFHGFLGTSSEFRFHSSSFRFHGQFVCFLCCPLYSRCLLLRVFKRSGNVSNLLQR